MTLKEFELILHFFFLYFIHLVIKFEFELLRIFAFFTSFLSLKLVFMAKQFALSDVPCIKIILNYIQTKIINIKKLKKKKNGSLKFLWVVGPPS